MPLLPENEEAATVFMLCRRQVVTVGSGQVVDISLPAIQVAMDAHQVQDRRRCLTQVVRLFHEIERGRHAS